MAKAPDYYKYLTKRDKVELKYIDFVNMECEDMDWIIEQMEILHANATSDEPWVTPEQQEFFFEESDAILGFTPVPAFTKLTPPIGAYGEHSLDKVAMLIFLLGTLWAYTFGVSLLLVLVTFVGFCVPVFMQYSEAVDEYEEINKKRFRNYNGRKFARVFEACRLWNKHLSSLPNWEEEVCDDDDMVLLEE